MGQRVGLVLAGGGARGAYELGALSVLLPVLEQRSELPTIFVGTSVGAITAASMAATRHVPAEEALARALARWSEIDRAAIIRPIIPRLPLTALRFLGGLVGLPGVRLSSLLDPAPLERNLDDWIDWAQLHRNVTGRSVRSLAVIATAARSGRTVAFVEGHIEKGAHSSHVIDYVPATIEPEHVRASAAIPILFPPVQVKRPAEAGGWYVDGSTRLHTPIKPAIDLGADRLIVIGTESPTPPTKEPGRHRAPAPDFGTSALHLLQGALTDPLAEDMRQLGDINSFYADAAHAPGAARHRRAHGRPRYRSIPYIFIAPRRPNTIARLAAKTFRARYGGLKALRSPELAALSRLLGGESPSHSELLSYLLFDREFIKALIGAGRDDARAWLRAEPGPDEPWQTEPLDAFAIPARATR